MQQRCQIWSPGGLERQDTPSHLAAATGADFDPCKPYEEALLKILRFGSESVGPLSGTARAMAAIAADALAMGGSLPAYAPRQAFRERG